MRDKSGPFHSKRGRPLPVGGRGVRLLTVSSFHSRWPRAGLAFRRPTRLVGGEPVVSPRGSGLPVITSLDPSGSSAAAARTPANLVTAIGLVGVGGCALPGKTLDDQSLLFSPLMRSTRKSQLPLSAVEGGGVGGGGYIIDSWDTASRVFCNMVAGRNLK